MPLPATTPLRDVIRRFKQLGWTGPETGGKHLFMRLGKHRQRIPNTHSGQGDVRLPQLREILRQAGITEEEWLDE